MIGFDFNGVVDTEAYRPSIDSCIITGNSHVEGVLDWLAEHNIKCRVYFPPTHLSNKAAGVWKATMINLLNLEKFYEDEPEQYEIIKESCPRCIVVKV